RERHVIAIASDVADAKWHSIQGDDFPFGPEKCTYDRAWRCLLDDGVNLAGLRIKASRRTNVAAARAHVARGNESAVFADIGPFEINIQVAYIDVSDRKRRVRNDVVASRYVSDLAVTAQNTRDQSFPDKREQLNVKVWL